MARLELALLGGLRMSVDGTPVTGFDKTRALLAYLAIEAARSHTREELAGLFWPELPEEAARRNLRNSLFQLRGALGEPGDEEGAPGWLLVTARTVQLDPAAEYEVDVAKFSRLLDACDSHRHRHVERCATCHTWMEQAIALYQGELLRGLYLPDCAAFEEWLALRRERLQRQACQALARLATYHDGRGEVAPALEYALRYLELEPWREDARRQAMRLLALSGQPSAALAQHETFRQLLAAELNAEPDAETTALYEKLKAEQPMDDGRWTMDDEAVASSVVRRPSSMRHNLQPQLAPFIGREAELRLLIERLDSPDFSLITVIGPGGVGKTRLAWQAAREQVGAFRDGVYWVALAATTDPDVLPFSIAQAVGLRFEAAENPSAQLLDYLRDKEMLLVFDNFEQFLGPRPNSFSNPGATPASPPAPSPLSGTATDLLLSILSSAPQINLLVTSRERLGLQAELLLDLAGLPLPEADDGSQPASFAGSGPIVHPSQAQDPSSDALASYSAVQLFVERAKQANAEFTLTEETARGVVEICRLVAGLPLGIVLAAAWVRHLLPERIAASIRANLDFLASSARDAAPQHASLRAVFDHSWALLSEEEQQVFRRLSVFQGGWDEEAAKRVAGASLGVLLSLVDKSLLRQAAGERFDLHEVLRQYAAERLQEVPEELAAVRQGHARYFLDLAEEAATGLQGERQEQWLARLEHEHDNLRAALLWAQANGQAELGLRLGAALSRYWFIRGYYGEGRAALEAMLSLPPGSSHPSQPDELRSLKAYRAKALRAAGNLARAQGDYSSAHALCAESLALYRELGDRREIAVALNHLAIVPWNQGNRATKRALFEESLALGRELGDKAHIGITLGNLANMAFVDGDYATARALLEEGVILLKEVGDKFVLAIQLNNLGNVALMQGDYIVARLMHIEGLALRQELNDKWGIAVSLIGIGGAAVIAGDIARGTRLLGAATALLDAIGATLEEDDRIPLEHATALARAKMDGEAFEIAWAEGQAMSTEQAISYALEVS